MTALKKLDRVTLAQFGSQKEKWLTLYYRFLARMTYFPKLSIEPHQKFLSIIYDGNSKAVVGRIAIRKEGIELQLALGKSKKLSSTFLLNETRKIDDDLISMIRASTHRVRTAIGQST